MTAVASPATAGGGLSAPSDPLDAPDYDPITHLNAIFTHPSTLPSVSHTHALLRSYASTLDAEISSLSASQASSHASSVALAKDTSQTELATLCAHIDGVRERARRTEEDITGMTAEIKRLDATKRNLTKSMTALKRLQMLTTAYEQLRAQLGPRGGSQRRQYRECAQLLAAVMQLAQHFKSYRSIDQIAALARGVAELQREVLELVCEDFELAFSRDEVGAKRGVLAEACLVVDALGDAARARLVTWYTNTELRQYRQIFRGDQEAGSLDNIDRRYKWFKKTLKTYDEEHASIFPAHWRVGEHLANVFAEGTRDDYKGILSRTTRAGQTLDVALLLSCLQQTLEFEQGLERRFVGSGGGSRASIDTMTSERDGGGATTHLTQPISTAFEPYLSLWVDAQDKELGALVPAYRARPPKPPDEDFSPQTVVASASELFNFYRLSLAQCAKLSTGEPLLALARVFGRYLDMYAQQVLLGYLEGRPTIEDTILVLNTADYCYTTTSSLSDKIVSRLDEPLKEGIDLSSQADAFMGLASASIRGLLNQLSAALAPHFSTMRSTPFSRIETASDTSPFLPSLLATLTTTTHQILDYLKPLKPHYTRAFTDALPALLADTYLLNIPPSRPISEGGAEQMLLDLHSLRSTLQTLPYPPPSEPPASYTKRVQAAVGRVEPLLKTLQTRPSPPEALVQAYLVHVADLSDANFRKVLELKGLRRQNEQAPLVELFNMHKLSPRYKDSLVERSSVLTALTLSSSAAPGAAGAGGAGASLAPPGQGGVYSSSAANNQGAGAGGMVGNVSNVVSGAAQSFQNNLNLSNSNLNLPATATNAMSNIKSFDASGLASGIMDRFSSSPALGGGGNTPVGPVSPPAGMAASHNPMDGPAAGLGVVGAGGGLGLGGQQAGGMGGGQGGAGGLGQAEGKLNENLKNIGKFFRRDHLSGFAGGLGGRFGGGGGSPAPPGA